MKLKFAFAALLVASSFNAMAADQTLTVPVGQAFNFVGVSTASDSLLSGGSDTLTFKLATQGTYDVKLSFSSLDATITSATLNGVTGTLDSDSISFGKFIYTGASPFTLVLNGTLDVPATAAYSGQIKVSAVPEPESYAMMLGGLGLVGFMAARRRKAKAA